MAELMNQPALDWDRWRTDYPHTTLAEQQDFYTQVFAAYRNQRHYNEQAVSRAIQDVKPKEVVELGGWDGELASAMLDIYPSIGVWLIHEICREAAEVADTRHSRLFAPQMRNWYWTEDWTTDLLIASHVIEHMTAEELGKTIEATETSAIYLDAPLVNDPTDWTGYVGTHIIEVGWDGVDAILAGYTSAWRMSHDTGEARLYRR